jgi:hypothetical protein
MAGPGTVDDVLRVIAGQAEQPKYIRAYHGSPYDFDRFDASKIGTGEGAQAYGHGLYFAGKEGVARSYRDISPALLPPEAAELNEQLRHLIKQHSDLWGELQAAADTEGTFAVGWGAIKDPPEVAKARILPQLDAVNQQLQDVQGRMHKVLHNRRGHMYEVEIGRPEDELLDWDKPVAEQSDSVREAVTRALGDDQISGKFAYHHLEQNMGSPRAAADLLAARGVPGIRYLDGNSRRVGQGTRNYVMFPGAEDSIRILRKYGLMAPVAAGAAQEQR